MGGHKAPISFDGACYGFVYATQYLAELILGKHYECARKTTFFRPFPQLSRIARLFYSFELPRPHYQNDGG
jgi:hypothetical protein